MRWEQIISATIIAAAISAGVQAMQAETLMTVAPGAVVVSTTPVPLNRDDPGQVRIGALRYMGGVQIRSSNPKFGGFSALRAGPGTEMLSVSDTGNWLRFDLVEIAGRLTGITRAWMGPIGVPAGTVALQKSDSDSEALDWNPATGKASIVYEQDHRIVHFSGIDAARTETLAAIPEMTERLTAMTGWGRNLGGEAMAILPGGARVIIAEEDRRPDGGHTALLTVDGKTLVFGINGAFDYAPTDAIAVGATHILVLNRNFALSTGPVTALTLVDLAPVLNGAAAGLPSLPAKLLAHWGLPLTIDNMEGLAIRRTGSRIFIYMISDDNLSSIQRTLLLKFELDADSIR